MTQKLRIAVISHAIDGFANGGYLFHRLMDHWEPGSYELSVVNDPQATPPEADLAIAHVDMTRIDEGYQRLYAQYPYVINGRITDISKRAFSDQIVTRESAWDGPVIVKTDNNFGGMREMEARFRAGDPDASINIQRPWKRVECLRAYPSYATVSEVPLGVWRNPNLVVEKFLPEQQADGTFVLRVWVFFGDRGLYYQCESNEPIIKSHNTIRRQDLTEADLPQWLRQRREELGFDYGKFDFGIIDGKVVLYDVNRTPGTRRADAQSQGAQKNIRHLSEGLNYFRKRIGA